MRTIEPAIMHVHLPRLNSLIDDIVGSIVNLNQRLMQPANLRCRLRIDQGGLGVGLLDITPSAAYGASFIACFPSLFAMDPTILTSLRSDCDYTIIQAFRSAISTINYNDYDAVSILSLSGLNMDSGDVLERKSSNKLQHKFMEQFYELEKTEFLRVLSASAEPAVNIARYMSTCGSESGAVILAAPKTPALSFTPEEYRIMLRRRWGLDLFQIHDGLRCNCHNNPVIDKRGIHCVTICKRGQGRNIMHNRVNSEVAAMCRYAQIQTRLEPTDIYRAVDGDDGKRPDIELRGFQELPLLGDVAITEPVC